MHWRNSAFQIRHFLIGACHTADEAYRMGMQLKEEREQALAHARFSGRKLAFRMRWLRLLRWLPVWGELAKIEIDKLEAEAPHFQALVDACVSEIASIDECLRLVQPHRRYAGLPDPVAHQACQEAEWLAELRWRAENYLLAGGPIPHDQIAAMRMHPAFESGIWPHVQDMRNRLKGGMPLQLRTEVARLLEDKQCRSETTES